MTTLLSIDCGLVNMGMCICTVDLSGTLAVQRLDLLKSVSKTSTVNRQTNEDIRAVTRALHQYRFENAIDVTTLVLIEQQPHINRRSCMVHDVVSSVFHDCEQLNIHPSIKNRLVTDTISITQCPSAKPQKQLTKTIAAEYIANSPSDQVRQTWMKTKKKDDLADAIC